MSAVIKNLVPSEEKKCDVHFIPCKLDCRENPNKDIYFRPKQVEGSELLECSLRGFPLSGKEIDLPPDCVGIVMKESFRPNSSTQSRTLRVAGTFDKFTHWNWDKKPSRNDKLLYAFDWLDISNAIHAPFEENDSTNRKNGGQDEHKE